MEDNDIPLVANTDEILVKHYVLNLTCCLEENFFNGSVLLYLEPVRQESPKHKTLCSCALKKTSSSQETQICQSVLQDISTSKNLELGKCSTTITDSTSTLDKSMVCCVEGQNSSLEKACDSEKKLKSCKPINSEFVCILDCSDILVIEVAEVVVEISDFEEAKYKFPKSPFPNKNKLNFAIDKWSLKIWKTGIYCQFCFPAVIEIVYRTKPEGLSLLWVKDQDGRPAVYTYGSEINNRSLIPCQEKPAAISSWEAIVTVDESAIVLMNGNNEPLMVKNNGTAIHYCYNNIQFPLSTLALAVGFWEEQHITGHTFLSRYFISDEELTISIRIFAPSSLLQKAVDEFSKYIVSCVHAAETIFGPYPFPKLDILIVPKGFGSLGMASPNIMFLSQSLLAGDGSMCSRLAHEVCHAWFGLLIGASDWTEEWLSEGFATFMEDIVHAKALSMTASEEKEFSEIQDFLRLKTLQSEIENTEEDLQILRPNKGHIQKGQVDGEEAVILKNSKNPQKSFMQGHYIKGHFLLRLLSRMVDTDQFLEFLKMYVMTFRWQLVGSKDVLELYIQTFSKICQRNKITADEMISKWLHNSGIPSEIANMRPTPFNQTYNTAMKEANKWKKINVLCLKMKKSKRNKFSFEEFLPLSPNQVVIVLEDLLDVVRLVPAITEHISEVYNIRKANAEVRHRWCELVVKNKWTPGYEDVTHFLQEDLAMGVYLYGEMLLSNEPLQKIVAEECFEKIKEEMEPNFVITIQQMLNSANEKNQALLNQVVE